MGLYMSYTFDFPSGPTIVCFLGLLLILAGLTKVILFRPAHEVRLTEDQPGIKVGSLK